MSEKKEELIETIDENGNKVCFELIDMLTVDDVEYALLMPSDEHAEHENSCECGCEDEIIVMRVKRDGEEFSFETIDDDDEFEKVAAYIEEIEEEIDD